MIISFDFSFNTASGMDCMQFADIGTNPMAFEVSIPQAVWIACNVFSFYFSEKGVEFQYRKRYGLHAISDSDALV